MKILKESEGGMTFSGHDSRCREAKLHEFQLINSFMTLEKKSSIESTWRDFNLW